MFCILLPLSFFWLQFQKLALAHTLDFVITVPHKIKLLTELVLIKKKKCEREKKRRTLGCNIIGTILQKKNLDATIYLQNSFFCYEVRLNRKV